MKVMCIKNGAWHSQQLGIVRDDKLSPSFGEICTVVEVLEDAYRLLEYPKNQIGNPTSFAKSRFIPLSEIDETELVNKKETVEQ